LYTATASRAVTTSVHARYTLTVVPVYRPRRGRCGI